MKDKNDRLCPVEFGRDSNSFTILNSRLLWIKLFRCFADDGACNALHVAGVQAAIDIRLIWPASHTLPWFKRE
ncbi:hypothetical protein [Burkholderia vietnamiensis]|uniref:hypothetical protein n=1 Tax=Burkholderia vietnamiensis TaxID=60552 RepID=UPI00158D8385|nr:hypothetical protein [Burkholderia vietnamiensis]